MGTTGRLVGLHLVLLLVFLVSSLPSGAHQAGTCRGLPDKIDHGVWPASCSNAGVGATCTARCEMNAKYWYNKTGTPRSKCKTDGHWSEPERPEDCHKQPAQGCLGSPIAPNSVFTFGQGGSSSIGAICVATCNAPNYVPAPGGAPSATCRVTITPERTVTWSAVNGGCRIACTGNPQQPAHGSFSCASPALPGSNCSATCAAGYRASQQGAPTATCQADGTYNAVTGACELIVCTGHPQQPAHGSFSCASPALPGSNCSATCAAGYRASQQGAPTATCQADGTYNAVTGACELIVCTGNPPQPENGTFTCDDPALPDSVCNATCDAGNRASELGVPAATCQADGTYSEVTGACELIVCTGNPPQPENGTFASDDPALPGSVCNATCDAGNRASELGVPAATCQADGTYSEVTGACELIVCTGNPPQPANGTFMCSSPALPSSVCSATCATGYRASEQGAPTATCQANGTYTAVTGACERIVCTGNPPQPANGTFTCPSPALPGSNCSATCAAGYRASQQGAPTATCQADGTYNAVTGACELIVCTGHPQQPAHGSFSCASPTLPGSNCSATCAAGYRASEQGAPTATCQANGTYSGSTGACELIVCTGNPQQPANGTFTCSSPALPGSNCSATCATGYRASQQGAPTATCQANGTYGAVTGACERIVCTGNPPQPANGNFACASPALPGSVCTATCCAECSGSNAPYATCQANGTYSAVTGLCTPISGQCSTKPAGPTGGNFGYDGCQLPQPVPAGSVYLGSCSSGYAGNLSFTCSGQNTWATNINTCTAFNTNSIGRSFSPTLTTGASGSSISAGAGANLIANADVSNSVGFQPQNLQCITNAVSGNHYFQLTVTPTSGRTLKFFKIRAARGGNSTPRGLEMRSSADGYTAPLLHFTLDTTFTTTPFPAYTFKLPGVTTATTFRVYGYAPGATSYLDITSIGFYGVVN